MKRIFDKMVTDLVVLLLFVLFVYGVVETVNNFNGEGNPFNITWTVGENQTFFIQIPTYSFVDNVTLDLTGHKIDNAVFLNSTYTPFNLSHELIAVYNFNDGTRNDSHSNNHLGTTGSTNSSGIYLSGRMYDGSVYDFNASIGIDSNFTVSLWIKPNSTNSANPSGVISIDVNDPYNNGWVLRREGTQYAWVINANVVRIPLTDIVENNETWYHIVFGYNGTAQNLWLDGVLKDSLTYAWTNTQTGIYLGKFESATPFYWTGAIDEVYIWNRSLTDEEIINLSQSYPNNVTIYLSDEEIYNKTGFFNGTEQIILNNTQANDLLVDGCNCSGCSLVGENCNIPLSFYSFSKGILQVNLTNTTYSYGLDNCSQFTYSIVNFSYYNQDDNSRITLKNAYDLSVTSPFTQTVQGSFEGQNHNRLCSRLNHSERSQELDLSGQFTLTKDLFATQIFEISSVSPLIINNSPVTQQEFYLRKLNESSTIVFTWLTTEYEVVDGTMNIYECLGNGSRVLIESPPIIDGDASANIDLINTPYSYEVIYNGVVYTDEDSYTKCHVETQSTAQYFINIGTDISPVIGLYSIPCNLTKTNNFTITMEWGTNPQSTETITGCIFAERVTVAGASLVYQNCTTTENPLIRTVPDSGFTYSLYGRLFQGGYSIQCKDQIQISPDVTTARTFGLSGIFAVILFIVGMVFIFSNENPKWYPLIAGLSLAFSFVLGVVAFGWITVSSLFFFLLIIIIIGRHSKKQ